MPARDLPFLLRAAFDDGVRGGFADECLVVLGLPRAKPVCFSGAAEALVFLIGLKRLVCPKMISFRFLVFNNEMPDRRKTIKEDKAIEQCMPSQDISIFQEPHIRLNITISKPLQMHRFCNQKTHPN